MATIEISDSEKVYVLHGIQDNVRVDGRGRKDVRPIVLESGLVSGILNSNLLAPEETLSQYHETKLNIFFLST